MGGTRRRDRVRRLNRAGLVRQAAFKGLREDKPAVEVEAEKPASPEATAVLPKLASRLKVALRKPNPLHKGGKPVVMGVLIFGLMLTTASW